MLLAASHNRDSLAICAVGLLDSLEQPPQDLTDGEELTLAVEAP